MSLRIRRVVHPFYIIKGFDLIRIKGFDLIRRSAISFCQRRSELWS